MLNPLPLHVLQPLLPLADKSDFLLFGELHGTQEVPELIAGLLDVAASRGYGGLALEVPADQREQLTAWAWEQAPPPPFFAQPHADGRGNEQVLALVQAAVQKGWSLLCFDQEASQPYIKWTQRDADMARNLTMQRERLCPGQKVLGICGNLHSRLTPHSGVFADLWPSFASALQALNPSAVASTVAIVFHQGEFYNGGAIHPINGQMLAELETREDEASGHSLTLHLPNATAATFLALPQK